MLNPRRPEILALIAALYIALVLNLPFWRKFHDLVSPHSTRDWLFLAAAGVVISSIAYLALLAVSLKPLS